MSSTTTTTTTRTTTTSNNDDAPSTSVLASLPYTRGVINYLDRSVDKPYTYLYEQDKEPANNHVYVSPTVNISDLRHLSHQQRIQAGFTTDHAGFQIIDGFGSPDTPQQWADRKWDLAGWLESTYYSDVDQLLKSHLGVTSTFIFDHTVRKRRTKEQQSLPDTPDNRTPVAFAHSDQSRKAGENRIEKHLGNDTLERVKRGELHAQLINVWRPLRGQAWDTPLAVADSRTVSRGQDGNPPDWRETELRYPTWTGETLSIHPNPDHRWYYYSGLPTDKAILLKCYDSRTETRTPHTAFTDPQTPADAEPRWSVEVRVLAITDPSAKGEASSSSQA
ncbi:uncharacterized protein PFL1_01614 [Pseudozyma flocculosa PF-1]|uniref:Related to 7alpha-cephem-methoxylase P8 chain n=1 Tax=Pseudozyma flocculosa TaxID=84751 RepID=A0A5C3EXW7_9BASI|nr:uncharacterized protein PFL1_01614 [Pseudozyma flocculosa PF-1]EPQ30713.1 hypothetical protein PFL1_01614 [Pseudozyma flocculosa PF-1]SPO36942.1 related to 7alpha-cephem-methoxylase P8 chain [Pseudozyma flocculosa]